MNESEFFQRTDALFEQIEAAIDDNDLDADCVRSGNVLEIEFDVGGKVVVNRHAANQEVWVAAKSGGYHFAWRNEQWIAARDGAELYATLIAVIRAASGQEFNFGN